MEEFSVKEYLCLRNPTEEDPVSDQNRIRSALSALGYCPVHFPIPVIRKLYPHCRKSGFQITATLVRREWDWVIVDVEAGDTRNHHYGLAVDYGSTTMIMQLVDLHSGYIVGEAKTVNGQTQYGSDILTRITYALEDKIHLDDLHKVTIQSFHRLLGDLTESTGVNVYQCPLMVVSGNTTMIHFLLKLDAWSVFASPYAPIVTDPGFYMGGELGMDFPGMVYIVPAASNYIGGDIVSGLLDVNIHNQDHISLFFDIGTNGELVIGNKDWLVAGAGAAGPALEGYISKFGMRAAPSAVDSVRIVDSQLIITTIDNQRPAGICGSGIIDLLAQMRLHGWINMAGELNPSASDRIIWIPEENQYAVVYAFPEASENNQCLYFSQTDINQYLDTKAAAYTMIECLLESTGLSFHEISKIHLSGAFAAHSNLESAITIGLFPDLPRDNYTVKNNTSLDGARALLLDYTRLAEVKTISENMHCVQFASIPDFLVRMQAAKFVPHTDMARFPNINNRVL